MSAPEIEVTELRPDSYRVPGVTSVRRIFELIPDSLCGGGGCLCQQLPEESRRWKSGDPTTDLPVAPIWTPGGAE